jgi:WD40 repeat protein/mono/diheme cytochrome c family protein
MKLRIQFIAFFSVALLFRSGTDASCVFAQDTPQQPVSFARDVQPIFRAHCQGCHQPAKPQGGFTMITHADLLRAGESGDVAVVAKHPEQSYLLAQIATVDGQAAMPKNAPPLSAADVELIRRWIEEGAIDDSPAAPATRYDAQHPPVYSRAPVTTALAFSPDGRWLAVNGFQEVLIVDAASMKTVNRLVGLSERVESVSFSRDSKRLAVTGGSPGRFGEIQVWDVASAELILSHQTTFDTVYGGSFSPDGKLVAFGAADNVVRAIDAETGEKRLHQGAHEDWVLTVAFNPTGTHLLSAGRDMTVKLTEVETERFVDNVTSITPGALRGGIAAVVSHPERDEILVGGADGVPKIYRIFRQTARVIGDDANLIRSFPAMPGRIFSVSITPDGKQFVAASTLDGSSYIRVYPYDFNGETPENVAGAMAKTYDERNDEEKRLVNQHLAQSSAATLTLDLPGVSLYSVSFSPAGNKVAVGGSDGLVRIIDVASRAVEMQFTPVDIQSQATEDQSQLRQLAAGHGIAPDSSAIPDPQQERALLPQDKLLELHVEPSFIQLQSSDDAVQLVVSAVYANGQVCDVTRLVSLSGGNESLEVSPLGLVRPRAPGGGHLSINFQDTSLQVAFDVTSIEGRQADFIHDVNPILSRLGCNAGTCHGAQKGEKRLQTVVARLRSGGRYARLEGRLCVRDA